MSRLLSTAQLIGKTIIGAAGLLLLWGLLLATLFILAPEVHADEDEPGFEWITGTVGGDSVNLIKNQITEDWSWTTGTIGEDTVNLNELSISDEWDWTTGTIGEESINLNSLKVQWDDDE
jgi:hypothetical protein